MTHFEKHPVSILTIGIIGAALSAIFVRYSNAPSLVTATFRLLWTVVLMLPLLFFNRSFLSEIRSASKKAILLCAVSGIFLALHFTVWFESLNCTSVASSTAIVCTEVIWVAIGYRCFMNKRISLKAWISIGATLIGSVIIALADMSGGNSISGDLLALSAAVFAALYTLIGTEIRKNYNMTTTSYTFIVYFFCTLVLCIAMLIFRYSFIGYGPSSIIVGLLLCVFSTFLGHTIFSWCLKYLSPTFVSASKLCQPVVAAIAALILFNEIPSTLLIIGGIITIAGVMYYSKVDEQNQ